MHSPSRASNEAASRAKGGGTRGSVSAEFAAALPAVVLVLAVSLVATQVAGEQLRLQQAVAGAARSMARGETVAAAATVISRAMPGAELAVENEGELVCARASAPSSAASGLLKGIVVTAASCALAGGR